MDAVTVYILNETKLALTNVAFLIVTFLQNRQANVPLQRLHGNSSASVRFLWIKRAANDINFFDLDNIIIIFSLWQSMTQILQIFRQLNSLEQLSISISSFSIFIFLDGRWP